MILRNDVAGSNSFFFNRSWAEFTREFGNLSPQYWIGLDRLHLATQMNCQVRFDLQSTSGAWYHAQYSIFKVGDSSTNYKLAIGGYSGDAYDPMAYHNGHQFTTYDRDNDGSSDNCAIKLNGGFWFSNCASADITTGPASTNFVWFNPADYGNQIRLNLVLINLIC